MRIISFWSCVVVCGSHILASVPSVAEVMPGSAEAYDRAASLKTEFEAAVHQVSLEPVWIADGEEFLYRREFPEGEHDYQLVTAASGERRQAFDVEALAEALNAHPQLEPVDAKKLPLANLRAWKEGEQIWVEFEAVDMRWRSPIPSLRLEKVTDLEEASDHRGRESASESMSSDGQHVAYFRRHNVYIRRVDDGEEIQLSHDGQEDDRYGPPVFWSPQSNKLAVWRTRQGKERLVHYVDSAPDDQLQPKHFTRTYAKPGDEIETRAPYIFTTDWTSKQTSPDRDLMPNPFATRNLAWDPSGSHLTFEYIERGFGIHRILALDPHSGETSVIIDETSETFVDAFHKGFRHDLTKSDEILWASERDGWNHLYLVDDRTGAVKCQVTKGPWVLRGVDHVDEVAREVIFHASGVDAEQDPYFVQYFRIGMDGTGLRRLTDFPAHHTAVFSPNKRYLIASASRVDMAPRHELRSAETGECISVLEEVDMRALLEAGWVAPEVFVSKDRDGVFDIWGLIFRPTSFDPAVSYPVIEHIYAGPHSAFVPKSFRAYHSMQAMAELGFIVVKMDGKGTSHRERAFHHFCHRNLGDSGFPDRIAWMRAAASACPQMDLDRVGIYGGSAGGQSALRALLAHGDFYDAAVADCGCHDNRIDKIWWNELWMDWPVGPHYEAQSNVTQAHRLDGKLFLTVGELDTNVDPASTYQVVDALIKADKDFEMLVVPGANHGVGESPYAARRRQDFFVRHLLKVEPRHDGK